MEGLQKTHKKKKLRYACIHVDSFNPAAVSRWPPYTRITTQYRNEKNVPPHPTTTNAQQNKTKTANKSNNAWRHQKRESNLLCCCSPAYPPHLSTARHVPFYSIGVPPGAMLGPLKFCALQAECGALDALAHPTCKAIITRAPLDNSAPRLCSICTSIAPGNDTTRGWSLAPLHIIALLFSPPAPPCHSPLSSSRSLSLSLWAYVSCVSIPAPDFFFSRSSLVYLCDTSVDMIWCVCPRIHTSTHIHKCTHMHARTLTETMPRYNLEKVTRRCEMCT